MAYTANKQFPEEIYLQITTRCNMHCDHCCFSCGELDENNKPKGEHMTLETLRNAIELRGDGTTTVIGGGEPTMHPRFWEMFGTIMEHTARYGGGVYLVTNGKLTQRAIALSMLSRNEDDEGFRAALSRTQYHDEIHPSVEHAFRYRKLEIRGNGRSFSENGRARDTGSFSYDRTALALNHPSRCRDQYQGDGCCCKATKIEPDGTVRQCGCDGRWTYVDEETHDIWEENPARGNVNDPESLTEFFNALNSEDEELASRMQGCWRDNVEPVDGDDEGDSSTEGDKE